MRIIVTKLSLTAYRGITSRTAPRKIDDTDKPPMSGGSEGAEYQPGNDRAGPTH